MCFNPPWCSWQKKMPQYWRQSFKGLEELFLQIQDNGHKSQKKSKCEFKSQMQILDRFQDQITWMSWYFGIFATNMYVAKFCHICNLCMFCDNCKLFVAIFCYVCKLGVAIFCHICKLYLAIFCHICKLNVAIFLLQIFVLTCMTAAINILGRRPNLSLGKQEWFFWKDFPIETNWSI